MKREIKKAISQSDLMQKWGKLENTCEILHKIAKNYPPESEEFRAIECAANAMFFVLSEKTRQQFINFLESMNQPMTKKMQEYYDLVLKRKTGDVHQ